MSESMNFAPIPMYSPIHKSNCTWGHRRAHNSACSPAHMETATEGRERKILKWENEEEEEGERKRE